MVTGTKDGSNSFVKRVASSFSMRKKKNADDPKGLPRSKSTGADYGSRRVPPKNVLDLMNKKRIKSAGVSPQPRREKIDDKQFGKWRYFDDSDSVWLSSDCTSSSSFLEERRLSVSFHFSVDERVVSWLSNLASSSLTLDNEADSIKGHRRSSKRGERLVPRNTKGDAENTDKETSKEGKIRNSSVNSVGKFSGNPSEGNKTGGRKSCEGTISSNNLMTAPNSTGLDSSLQVSEAKRVSFSRSAGAELEREPESSSSPSNSGVVPLSDPQISQASTLAEDRKQQFDDKCLEEAKEIVNSKKKKIVEPLFWPLEQKFDWTPEDILKHFSMSPRRKKSLSAKISAVASPRSMRAQLQTRKLDFKDGCKRKLVFNSPGAQESKNIPELRRTISNNSNNSSSSGKKYGKSDNSNKKDDNNKINGNNKTGMKRIRSMPSRLGKSSKISSKVVPLGETEETEKMEKEKRPAQKLNRKSGTCLEDDFASINDFSIEDVVGFDKEKASALRLNHKSRTCLEDEFALMGDFSIENIMEIAKKKRGDQKFNRKSRTCLEDDFVSMNDFSIENIVGLGEFKGREGIDSDFSGDLFVLDDSL